MITKRSKKSQATKTTKPLDPRWAHFRELFKQKHTLKRFETGKRFIEGFKFALIRSRYRSYLVDLKRSEYNTPLCVAVSVGGTGKAAKNDVPIYETRISFAKGKTIVVNAMQGTHNYKYIRDFESATKMPIAMFVALEIEQQGRALGYKRVMLPVPETLSSYNNPWVRRMHNERAQQLEKRRLDLSPSEKAEFDVHVQTSRDILLARIKNTYDSTAAALGYKKQGAFYIKEL